MALTFGAVNTDRVVLQNGLDNLNAFTVLMWAFCTTHTNNRRLWSKSVKVVLLQATNAVGFSVARATLAATAVSANSVNETNVWICWAFTYDETDGPRIFKGKLDSTIAEVSYAVANPVVGSGASSDDSGVSWRIANGLNATPPTQAFQGRVGVFAHFQRRFSLAEIVKWQFRPYTDADSDIFIELGFSGGAGVTQPNWTTLGAAQTGTTLGATVGAHVPLGPPFGVDLAVAS